MDQKELEPINELVRGAVIEEFVGDPFGGVILSFRGDVPDLKIMPFDRETGDKWTPEIAMEFLAADDEAIG